MTIKMVFVDHNVNAPAYAGSTTSLEAAIVRAAVARQFDSFTSQMCQETLRRTFQKPGASDFEPQDPQDAIELTECVADYTTVYPDADVRLEMGLAKELISSADYSDLTPGKEKPDFEDARVLATALAAAHATGEVAVVVTNDEALWRCVSRVAVFRNIAIVNAQKFANMMSIRPRAAA